MPYSGGCLRRFAVPDWTYRSQNSCAGCERSTLTIAACAKRAPSRRALTAGTPASNRPVSSGQLPAGSTPRVRSCHAANVEARRSSAAARRRFCAGESSCPRGLCAVTIQPRWQPRLVNHAASGAGHRWSMRTVTRCPFSSTRYSAPRNAGSSAVASAMRSAANMAMCQNKIPEPVECVGCP